MVSRGFVEAVKLDSRRAYKIAHAADVPPTVLSKIINGIEKVKPNDPRVLAVARVLGLSPDACFAKE